MAAIFTSVVIMFAKVIGVLSIRINCPTACTANIQDLPDFPPEIDWCITDYENWSQEIAHKCLYTAWPSSEDAIIKLVNWAFAHQFTVRPSGAMHNFAPFTVAGTDTPSSEILKLPADILAFLHLFPTDAKPQNILLMKTLKLTDMQITSNNISDASFWAQPGVMMSQILQTLQDSNLGFLNLPAISDVTIAGVLAIGGHGTAVKALNEQKSPGHTYGSLSNLILEVNAVVYDNVTSQYILKTFTRKDPEMRGLLVNLGRSVITNYTLRVGPLQKLQCKSYTNIPADELFAHPDDSSKNRTISYFLNTFGRVETIQYPFVDYPWTKVWNIAPEKPEGSREVTQPFNYAFSDNYPVLVSDVYAIPARDLSLAPILGPFMYLVTVLGLAIEQSSDIWGPSRTVFNYAKPTTFRYADSGHTILTSRADVQRVVYNANRIFQSRLSTYTSRFVYPINGPVEIRVTGVDDARDAMIGDDAEFAGMGASCPPSAYPDLDTVVYINIFTYNRTNAGVAFLEELTQDYYDFFKLPKALIRVEWCKGWGYNVTANRPWSNETFLRDMVLPNQCDSKKATDLLTRMDPYGVFTTPLVADIFKNYS